MWNLGMHWIIVACICILLYIKDDKSKKYINTLFCFIEHFSDIYIVFHSMLYCKLFKTLLTSSDSAARLLFRAGSSTTQECLFRFWHCVGALVSLCRFQPTLELHSELSIAGAWTGDGAFYGGRSRPHS